MVEIARAVSRNSGILLCETCIRKTKDTGQLKNVYDYEKRTELLKGAFTANRDQTSKKRLLLFDDLYRSGATVNAIAKVLGEEGGATGIYLLALTHTRRKS